MKWQEIAEKGRKKIKKGKKIKNKNFFFLRNKNKKLKLKNAIIIFSQ